MILTGAHEGKVIKLPVSGTFTIGRGDTCELVLDDDGISRNHARIVVSNGSVYVEDLDSRNGTFIGPQAIKRQRLLGDEVIRVGARTVLKFSLMDGVEEDYLRRLLSAALTDPLTSLYNRRHFDAVVQAEGVRLRITASFGVAQYQAGESGLPFFERADKALYDAKHSGKNRIVVARFEGR